MTTVFMIYAHQNQQVAQRVAAELTSRGARVWIDSESLTPGTTNWETSIRNGIEAADYVIFLASPDARNSIFANAEIMLARELDKLILPMWIDGGVFMDATPLIMTTIQHLDARRERFHEAIESIAQVMGLVKAPTKRQEIRVFISYSRVDLDTVNTLKVDLQQQDIQIWVDHEKLKPGEPDWQEAIRRGIQLVDQMIYIASPDARKSPNVNAELMLAQHFKKPIVPFWIAGESWIDATVFSLSLTQYINACGDRYRQGIKELVQRLELGGDSALAS